MTNALDRWGHNGILTLALLLVTGLVAGCAGRAGHGRALRPTNAELVLVARGSLHGLLVPTG